MKQIHLRSIRGHRDVLVIVAIGQYHVEDTYFIVPTGRWVCDRIAFTENNPRALTGLAGLVKTKDVIWEIG